MSSSLPKVLFVDDEEHIVLTLKSLCRREFDVYTALSGQEALDIVKNQHMHVVVSDQRMPEMPGIELLRDVKEISPDTMRIMLTGYADFDAIVGSVNDGEVFRYINKPWENKAVKQTVSEAAAIALDIEQATQPSGRGTPSKPNVPVKEPGILVIDGDRQVYDILANQFIDRREVVFSSNYERAVDILETHDIGVIVSDVVVGNQDVSSFLKYIKIQFPGIITVVLTAFRDAGMVVGLINEGQIFRFLPRPVSPGLLKLSVQTSLTYHARCRNSRQLMSRHKVETIKLRDDVQIPGSIINRLKSLSQKVSSW